MWPLSYQRCKNFGKSDKKLVPVPLVTFRKLELTRQAAPRCRHFYPLSHCHNNPRHHYPGHWEAFFGERWNRWHLVLVLLVRKDKAHCGISSTLKAANLRLHWHCVTLYFHIYFYLYLYLSTFSQLSRDTWSFKYLTLVSLSEFVLMLYLY